MLCWDNDLRAGESGAASVLRAVCERSASPGAAPASPRQPGPAQAGALLSSVSLAPLTTPRPCARPLLSLLTSCTRAGPKKQQIPLLLWRRQRWQLSAHPLLESLPQSSTPAAPLSPGRNRSLHLNPCLAYGEAGEGPGTVTLPSAAISLQRQQVTLVAPVLA